MFSIKKSFYDLHFWFRENQIWCWWQDLNTFLFRLSTEPPNQAHASSLIFLAKMPQSEPLMSHLYQEPACALLSQKSKQICYSPFSRIVFLLYINLSSRKSCLVKSALRQKILMHLMCIWIFGADDRTWTCMRLLSQGPEPCASAISPHQHTIFV